MKILLEKGRSAAEFDFPANRIITTLTGSDVPALDHERILDIIDAGIRKTAPGNIASLKVAVIIPDDTRLWARGDLYVPKIIETLSALGAAPENVRVIIALGTHAPIPEDRFPALCGQETVRTVRVINSAGRDRSRLADIGTTPAGTRVSVTREALAADHIVIFGGILHHMLAGFGGGRKYILPGICGEDTIQQNHALAMDGKGYAVPFVRQAELARNPVSIDMSEGAKLFFAGKTCCYVAVAANGRGEIFHAAAGPMDETFEAGCRILDRACSTPVGRLGDFALFSAGGYRADGQLYQSTKALFNAVNAVREGGSLLFTAACAEGIGNQVFEEALIRFRSDPETLGRALAKDFIMPAYVAFRVMDILRRYRVFLLSDLSASITRKLGFESVDGEAGLERHFQGEGYIVPFAENILPRHCPDPTI